MKLNPRWIATYIEHSLGYRNPNLDVSDAIFLEDIKSDIVNISFESEGGDFLESISILKAYSFVQKNKNFEKVEPTSYELFDFLKYEAEMIVKTKIAEDLMIKLGLLDDQSISFEILPAENNGNNFITFTYNCKVLQASTLIFEETKQFTFHELISLFGAELLSPSL